MIRPSDFVRLANLTTGKCGLHYEERFSLPAWEANVSIFTISNVLKQALIHVLAYILRPSLMDSFMDSVDSISDLLHGGIQRFKNSLLLNHGSI